MSDSKPTIGDPQDEFSLPNRSEQTLSELVNAAEFDDVHFFLNEGIEDEAINVEPTDDDVTFALIPYTHPEKAVSDEAFDLVEDAGFEQANLRDLLNLAIERPGLQREYEVVALATLRTRRIFEDRDGETVWSQNQRDHSICQWATGLSNLKNDRSLVPVEIYLDKVLRKQTLLLVRIP